MASFYLRASRRSISPGDEPMGRGSFLGASGLLLGITLVFSIAPIFRCGDGLSPTADPYSEANALRAGERFAVEGFTSNCGLPDVAFRADLRYPTQGIRGASGKDPDDTVYHGYPPGPDWLCGVYSKIFGVGHVRSFRFVPVAFGMGATVVFLGSLARTFGRVRALALYLACLVAPMFTNMAHGLHYHGYAQGLLLLEISALLPAMGRPTRLGVGRPALLALIGFAQGWMSFDYCFVVTFTPAAMALLLTPPDEPVRWGRVLVMVAASGMGFTLAHGLHFAQSVFYLGGVGEAMDEFAYRSRKMYSLDGTVLSRMSRAGLIGAGLTKYASAYVRWTQLFSPASIALGLATACAFSINRLALTFRGLATLEARFAPSGRDLAAIGVALLISLCWLCGKTAHAVNHIAFNARHLFLFFFACSAIVVRATELRVIPRPTNRPGRREGTSSNPAVATLGGAEVPAEAGRVEKN